MGVHADNDVPACGGDGGIQARRDNAAGVVDEAHAAVPTGDPGQASAGAVVGQTVRYHDLKPLCRVVLGQHRTQTLLDVRPLVAHGDHN